MRIQGVECISRQVNGGKCSHVACFAFDGTVELLNTGRYNLGAAIDLVLQGKLGYPTGDKPQGGVSYSALWHALVDAATVEPTVGLNAAGIIEVVRAMRAHDVEARKKVERQLRAAGIIEDPDIDGGILG